MSLRQGVSATYASQFYAAAIGILVLPIFLDLLGAEAFGLVGVFYMLQAWFQMLDFGLSPTLTRVVARFRGRRMEAVELRRVVRTLEAGFCVIALLGFISLFSARESIATDWLKVESLSLDRVSLAIGLMAFAVPLRWMSGLYRGAIAGFERQVWLAAFNSSIATVRFPGAIVAVLVLGRDPVAFFAYQAAIAFVEVSLLVRKTYLLLPDIPRSDRIRVSWSSLSQWIHFSGAVAVTGVLWTLLTQFDRLLLSRYLALDDFGYFTLGVTVAGAVLLLGTPMSQPLMPRLAKLDATGEREHLVSLYRTATKAVASIVAPAAVMFVAFSRELLWVWSGDEVASEKAAPILALYAIGNAFAAMSSFAYYLQFGLGTMRLHLLGNVTIAVVMLPCVWWAAATRGPVAVGFVWSTAMAAYFLLWVALSHSKLAPGLHLRWLSCDVLPPFVAAALVGVAMSTIGVNAESRIIGATALAVVGALMLLASVGAAIAPYAGKYLKSRGAR